MTDIGCSGARPAVFLDRDGTVIEDVPYLADPAKLQLFPGAADAIRRLRAAGFLCVIVTNQSAIGRGRLTVERLAEIHVEFERQLAREGTYVDAIEFCPVAPAVDNPDPRLVEHPDRKPGPGMLLRASWNLGIDLGASWMVGDSLSDVVAGWNAGCRGSILVRTGHGRHVSAESFPDILFHDVADLAEAATLILSDPPAPASRSRAIAPSQASDGSRT
ncbi:MAG: HAD family hydrolase [Isosphaeraceae bacterium]